MGNDGIGRLRQMMRDGDCTEAPGESYHRITLDLPPDDRAVYERCGICLRTLHPQRKLRLGDEWVCRLCAGLDQGEDWVLEHWLRATPEVPRRRLAMNFGIDPATRSETVTEVEFQTFHEDVDGAPTRLEVARHRGRILVFGILRCFWSVAPERDWL